MFFKYAHLCLLIFDQMTQRLDRVRQLFHKFQAGKLTAWHQPQDDGIRNCLELHVRLLMLLSFLSSQER